MLTNMVCFVIIKKERHISNNFPSIDVYILKASIVDYYTK